MRRALLIGILANGPAVVVARPGSPREIRDQFNALLAEGGRGFSEIQSWVSDTGLSKRKRFDAPESDDEQPLSFEDGDDDATAALVAEIAKLREDLKVTAGLLETAEAENAALVAERKAFEDAAASDANAKPPEKPPEK